MSAAVSVKLLGPLQVAVNGERVPLTAGRLCALLAVLALSPGRTVTIDRLATAVWADEDPPGNIRRSVQTYVARLRNALGTSTISTESTGYVLHADPEDIDIHQFVRLVGAASTAPDGTLERARLAKALDLWRGMPFEGVPCASLEASEAPWLLESYLTALERRIDLDISIGRHEGLVVELSRLTASHPLRESLWARLLLTLKKSGRRADALVRYETIRSRIADELGTNPDPVLQQIHAELLVR
ncbi:AfsR/SARP family transcriptional regulator [Actinomadura graeca]|uniref:AfsR/SARP family transcriptional regulator n=1 Tax=Actinomadura graeca TaxID=2750812 RepID=A0ABX8QUN5_9ACTN|nr:AfsR/SARP family transcriptional regulator [Actinomadura graeca]QXJ22455.1 AfsR/SARP family transcriptional regulator [Actinomadura graeca]